jgi:16S rRNA (cytosine1402-N4)-methyltransferase
MQHFPVMLGEVLEYLAVKPDGIYADVTAGLGGHSRAIAARLETGKLIMRDRDGESLERARANTAEYAARIVAQRGRFSSLRADLTALGVDRVDGLVADAGVSRPQLTEGGRGFSLMNDGPLDMRMSREETETPTAREILETSSEQEIFRLLVELGEERSDHARKIARALHRARPATMRQFAAAVESAVPRRGKLHPATKAAQALRIAVNSELEELDALMKALPGVMAPGGRVVVITFHSLESRVVKRAFQELARGGRARLLTKHVVRPAEAEVRANAASRSAELRALEMHGSE